MQKKFIICRHKLQAQYNPTFSLFALSHAQAKATILHQEQDLLIQYEDSK